MKSTQAEQWRPIPGYEGHYEVSNMGQVRSLDRKILRKDGRPKSLRGRVLSPYRGKSGHLSVALALNGAQRTCLVHRLVLLTFVGSCPDGMEACHWNDAPDDNRLENLRWAPRGDNNLDRVRNGIHSMAKKTHCKRGHEFTPENTRFERRHSGVSRRCIQCEKERAKRRQEKARAYRAKHPLPPREEPTHCKRGHEFTEENTYRYKNKAGKECKTCRHMRMQRWLRKKHPAN
ncbi:NUMOD4 motif-containing HNH endonuclease [Corynebacterium macclintockiae]|uniref:NUMOD4 motif-containing HNH endonuclease n=1 Tax=Corynebacterium macclintockiae TaxID=2913501 RepID=UPI003EBFDFE0